MTNENESNPEDISGNESGENEKDESVIDEISSSIPATGMISAGVFDHIFYSTPESLPLQDADGSLNLAAYAGVAYLEYAISVVKGRSLPDEADGQKPVQRRILYAMRSMGLSSSSKHMKSARVVGDVMGKYHPHGDSSIYDAAVRMAQDFALRYPLVDGQGNFGSRDGDGAAAMRYTEARLTPYAELLLSEIDGGTVDFKPNYDGSFEEPASLPARLPFVLLNGASGVAVGYATDIPSHNMREVSKAACLLIKNRDADLDEIMTHISAPDFPGGAQIISSHQAIKDIYATGKGGIRMRARWRKEEMARGQWRIIVTELPHGISTATILSEIEAATNPQIRKGKKDLSQEQKNVKALILGMLQSARDESDKAQPIRIVLEPKTSKVSEDDLMFALLAHTGLESSVPVNMVVIGLDGNPRQKTLKSILLGWIDYRFVTVERRTKHRLDQVRRRLHILQGRMKAFLRIEEVIRIIRESEDPRAGLMEKIGLSEIQAEDILEIRLRQLAKLEGIRIQKEADDLTSEESTLQNLLDNKAAMTKLILEEIDGDTKKYGDDRRTLVQTVDPIRTAEVSVADEPVTVLISQNGWVRSRPGHGLDRATFTWKDGDNELSILETRTTHTLALLDTCGRAYSIKASAVPSGRGDGVPMNTLITFQDGAKLAHVLSDGPDASYFFSNSSSYGFITQIRELETRQKVGKAFMTIEKGETLMAPVKVSDMNCWLIAGSVGPKESRLVMFPAHEMKVMPKGRGVIVMNLESGEKLSVTGITTTASPKSVSVVMSGGQKVQMKGEDLQKFMLHRARKGCQLSKRTHAVSVSE